MEDQVEGLDPARERGRVLESERAPFEPQRCGQRRQPRGIAPGQERPLPAGTASAATSRPVYP